ncbi:MAG: sigma-70 family RNA polymerase sigma factor [candidate division WOR-3 bacterium]
MASPVDTAGEREAGAADLDLIRQARAGDLGAFDELMRRYIGSIRRVTGSLLRNDPDADDMTQETFIRAFRSLGGFDERFQFYTWLRRIAVNLCFSHLKKRSRVRLVSLPSPDGEDEAADIEDPKSDVETAGLRHDLDTALAQLPADQRAVFVLRVDEEMSYSEISAALGIPVGTVMSRLNRARTRLRELLREYMPR